MDIEKFMENPKIDWDTDREINFMPGDEHPKKVKKLVKDQAEIDEEILWQI